MLLDCFALTGLAMTSLLDDEHRVVPSFVLFEAEEVCRRCCDVGKTPVAFLEAELAASDVIVKDARHLVERVAGLCLEGTVLVDLRHAGLLVDFVHFVGVTVVREGVRGRYPQLR